MTVTTRVVRLWLPAWEQLRSQLTPTLALHRLACRAERVSVEPGDAARLARSFDILPRGLPVAALTRQLDAGDAMHFTWLRADPGYVRPDMATVRLMACGDLDLSPDECEALLRPLKPLFGDEGFPISAPVASRWYLCLPPEAHLPSFAPPQEVLGDDLLAHLPDGNLGRRWRRLLNEAQVILHNHPLNAQRIEAGKLPVNTLWFWGDGRLPDHVRSSMTQLRSSDVVLRALAARANVACSTDDRAETVQAGALIDLRNVTRVDLLDSHWIHPLLQRAQRGELDVLDLDFGDGMALHWKPAHRWRIWRRQLPA
ncbi:phosphoglycerate mutase [Xanthomonadaceae bacterium JHOS43]|nr:phosphoglycerate mutase [Xanthomonadaceae bacterium JHOS43]MCX7563943.1 phosphoglycerate mutase [Xanthomonadaceae bacterium XH05]